MSKSKIKVVPNIPGFREVRRSAEMQRIVQERMNTALVSLGKGYKTKMGINPDRCYGVLYADTRSARIENQENNTILKALK